MNTQVVTTQPASVPVKAGFFDAAGFELIQRISKAFAVSTLVPEAYRDNISNCMIAVNMAQRMNADPLMVMQNLYIVYGNPGFSSKFLIASVNACGRFSSMRYEWRGEEGDGNYGCRAWAIERDTGERLVGAWVDWNMVRAEGWDKKSGSKWKSMPQQMFIYRAAAFWQRAYAPEISMGLSTSEELADVVDINADGSFTLSQEPRRAQSANAESVNAEAANPQTVEPETGEVLMPVCTDEHFAKNKEAWRKLIQSGRKSMADLIATISTKNQLTEAQLTEMGTWIDDVSQAATTSGGK